MIRVWVNPHGGLSGFRIASECVCEGLSRKVELSRKDSPMDKGGSIPLGCWAGYKTNSAPASISLLPCCRHSMSSCFKLPPCLPLMGWSQPKPSFPRFSSSLGILSWRQGKQLAWRAGCSAVTPEAHTRVTRVTVVVECRLCLPVH